MLRSLTLAGCLLLSSAGAAEPARYPLELALPRAAGTSPSPGDDSPQVPAGHRIFRAYPGIEYNIRAVVVGGAYPFAYKLANAPAGMTIDAKTGEIRWPKPAGSQATPTITVTDAEGQTASSPWTIAVTTRGFRFLDAVRGADANPGTLEKPWKTLAQLKKAGTAGEIVYFRNGVYNTAGMEASGEGHWGRVEFNGRAHPVQWIAYPGEGPGLDNEFHGPKNTGRFIRLSGSDDNPVYLDRLQIVNSWHIGLQFGSGTCDYAVFRRLAVFYIEESIDGANSAGIMTLTSQNDPSWYTAFQDCDFHDNACGGIKQYSQRKLVWEDCRFRDSGVGPDLKSDVYRFDVRGCSFTNNRAPYAGLFGNLHPARGGEVLGEIRFNRMLCKDDQLALDVNQDGLAGEIHIYRNTLVGGVRVRNTDAEDGPFHFTRNVIVNTARDRDRITFEQVSAPDRVKYTDNLTAAPSDGIVDAEGKLTGKAKAKVGTHGREVP